MGKLNKAEPHYWAILAYTKTLAKWKNALLTVPSLLAIQHHVEKPHPPVSSRFYLDSPFRDPEFQTSSEVTRKSAKSSDLLKYPLSFNIGRDSLRAQSRFKDPSQTNYHGSGQRLKVGLEETLQTGSCPRNL